VTTPQRRYVLAGGLVVVAVALGAIFGIVVMRAIAGYDITRVSDPTGATVTVGDRPLAVWAHPSTATTYCTSRQIGSGRESFSSPRASLSLTEGGRSWTRVGVVDGRAGSKHRLSCTAESKLTIGTADNPQLTRYVVLGVALAGTAVLLVLTAFTLALVTALRRPGRQAP
jgi:hypothetical protein